MAHELGLNEIWLKDDTCLPTGSFKDRASAMVVAMAREFGKDIIATASTGNAATALAGMATSAEMKSVIFVPESAPKAKLTQMAVYGARLVLVKGNYDQAFELSIEACKKFHWYNRNTAYNPYTVEGKKTAALEIWEQLEYSVPDWVIVPTGDGVILAGIEKGFYDLKQLGLSDRMPRLVCVQAEGASPIVDAVKAGNDVISSQLNPKTVADSISVGVPRAGNWVLKALKSTFGEALAVSDEEILSAISYLGKTTGIFAEPAAAAAIAGLKKMVSQNMIKNDERVVVLITGNGLKDVPAAMKSIEFPIPIEPSISFVRA
jgi:threonine synthase